MGLFLHGSYDAFLTGVSSEGQSNYSYLNKGHIFWVLFIIVKDLNASCLKTLSNILFSMWTYLLMYSPVRTFAQALHLKHPRCHCLSKASKACPFFISLPQPAQSANKPRHIYQVTEFYWSIFTYSQIKPPVNILKQQEVFWML